MTEYENWANNQDFTQIANQLWEHNAKWWQDGFTQGADPEYEEQIIPLLRENLTDSHSLLDIGTGEGQLTRVAEEFQNITMICGVDPTWEQVVQAKKRRQSLNYLKATASRLPFADGTFDTAVACLVFEHITELELAISEVSRCVRPGGKFLFFLNHPLMQTPGSGWIDDHIIEEQYWRIGPYLEEQCNIEEVEKDVYIPFIHRPLSKYLNTLAVNGLMLEKMFEPAPPKGFLDKAPEYYQAASIPRLLFLRLVKM